jgi:predicted kinase
MKPWLILVSGPPASGKTYVARCLAADLGWPCFAKDTFKEALFDALGGRDVETSRAYNQAAYLALFAVARELLTAGVSLLMESNYRVGQHEAPIAALQTATGCSVLQVHVDAPVPLLLARYLDRWHGGRRHPGHVDEENLAAVEAALRQGIYGPLEMAAPLIRVDTTDFAALDVAALVASVRGYVSALPPL